MRVESARPLSATLSIAMTVLAASCSSSTDVSPPNEVLDVFVGAHAQALAMDRGAVIPLALEYRNADGTILQANPSATYVSRQPTIAGVTATGVVVGLATGTTYVVATLNRTSGAPLTDSIAVTVVSPK